MKIDGIDLDNRNKYKISMIILDKFLRDGLITVVEYSAVKKDFKRTYKIIKFEDLDDPVAV